MTDTETNFHNATVPFLIDEIGQMKAQIKELEKRVGRYTEMLMTKLSMSEDDGELVKELSTSFGSHEGEKFTAVVEPAVGAYRIDAAKVRDYFADDVETLGSLMTLTESKGYKLTIRNK